MPTNNAANAQNAQYNLLVGTGSAYTNIAPSATSGVPLISQGAASNPAYGTAVVAGGGTGVTSNTAYAVLCGGTTSTNPIQSVASVGSAGQVLTSNGAGALPTFQSGGAPAGSMVQSVQSLYTTKLLINQGIPIDDTIPQNTEGQEVTTLSITPTNTNNILVITWNVGYCAEVASNWEVICALFQDTTANALCATVGGNLYTPAITYGGQCVLRYFKTAGTTSSTTFKIRMGIRVSGTNGYVLNGSGANRVFGGVSAGMFQIQEIKV
jgi:hypothetical protein